MCFKPYKGKSKWHLLKLCTNLLHVSNPIRESQNLIKQILKCLDTIICFKPYKGKSKLHNPFYIALQTFVSNPIRESQNKILKKYVMQLTCFKPYKGKSKYYFIV